METFITDTHLVKEYRGDDRVVWRSREPPFEKNSRRLRRAVPEVKTCRTKPPAKYRRLGAKTKNDYAFPECWMYPIHMSSERETKKHIRLAATRLSQHGHRYPKWVREKIARRLDAAKRRYGIGPYRLRTKRTARVRKAA